MKLFRIGKDSQVEIIQEESYRNREVGGLGEVTLQELITNHPELIPSEEIDSLSPPKFLVIKNEASLSFGSIDILLIDDKGIPTVVETKLRDNREIRRAVLAQGLEYLAHLKSEWPVERFFEEGTRFWAKRNTDLESVAKEKFGFALDDDFLQKVTSNINSNKLRLIIASDKIPTELKTLMEFINDASVFDVFGIEVKFFASKEQDYKILTPHLVGFTETTKERKQRTPNVVQKINEETFFNEVSKLGPEAVNATKAIYDWAKPYINWNSSSFSVLRSGISIFSVSSKKIEIYMSPYEKITPFNNEAKKTEFLQKILLFKDAIIDTPLKKIPLTSLYDKANLDQFLELFNWVSNELDKSSSTL